MIFQASRLRAYKKTRLLPLRRAASHLGGAATLVLITTLPGVADDGIPLQYNNYGAVGMIDMPTARMAPDGTLSVGASFTQNIQHFNLGFEALPWLEADFRYSGLQHFDPQFSVYYDRALALKARLSRESDVMPALAVGINDIVGTGIYSGEYFVASKRFGSVDTNLGIGWGRMGSTDQFRNPFTLFSSSFDPRPGLTTPGGTNFKGLFHGPKAGLFGGIAWATPMDGLSLLVEYSSDAYTLEQSRGTFSPHDQVNIGAKYHLNDTFEFGVNWLYGKAIGANFTLHFDPTIDPFPQRMGPPPTEPRVRTSQEQQSALAALSKYPSLLPTASFAGSQAMVDLLWRQDGALRDVGIQGHTLSLTASGGDLKAICENAAELVGRYRLAITRVRVKDGDRNDGCTVGDTGGFLITTVLDSAGTAPPLLPDSPLLVTIDATPAKTLTPAQAIAKFRADAAAQSITIVAVRFAGPEAIVYYENHHYYAETDPIDRLTRLLTVYAPVTVERFRMIAVANGQAQREFDVLRGPTERIFDQTSDLDFATEVSGHGAAMSNPVLAAADRKAFPAFSWSIYPQFRQQLFDPSNPFAVQFLAAAGVALDLAPGLTVFGDGELDLYDNFNVGRLPDSVLPHVRTDFLKFFTQGKNGIADLELDYRFRLSPDVFGVARAGYMESMYGGVGGQLLWRPAGQRWALGVDGYELQERNFDRLLGLQSYRVFTGHVSLYYASPWYGLNFEVHAGQYLAHDRGLTFQMTRRFSTGVELGAFFTKTNVSAAQFGEGSFDKGIIIRIPLGVVAPLNTQSEFDMDLRPVQRDGGQRLQNDDILFPETRRTSDMVIDSDLQDYNAQ